MATLTFWGAAQQVTGSCHLLETSHGRLLLDCGMFQGEPATEQLNHRSFPFDPRAIDAVVLSHAHLDHSGLLPKLAAEGFSGPVYLTGPSYDLVELMLKDAAFLEMKDTVWENKRLERAGKPLVEPLYTLEDVERLLGQRQALDYEQPTEVLPGVTLRFRQAGHILGAAFVELTVNEGKHPRTLVFSGDLGNRFSPLMQDPQAPPHADMLLLESTYGDRDHRSLNDTLEEFRSILAAAHAKGGNVLIPSFAVGRAQDLIYWLGKFHREGALPQHNVFLDSPMAITATAIYLRHRKHFNHDDAEFDRAIAQGWRAWLPQLTYSETTEDSMALNRVDGGAIIIAGSGMCTGGRIRHHLKYNLWKKDTHVVIAGFQPNGTLGRKLVDGAKRVTILGSEIAVKAHIHTLGGFSAHAGQTQLLQWAKAFPGAKPALHLVHGEPEAMQTLQQRFAETDWQANIAAPGQTVKL
ncbi:MBL fold metallo-hydrolase RNA specificity domain-containing protein [Methylogaea oryzae]|nr:MBL fold metallo-hydrolase [Methylogaea oryzae]